MKIQILQTLLVIAVIGGIISVAFAVVMAAILCGGWVLTWMVPTIPIEFACVISGLAVLTTIAVLVCIGRIIGKIVESKKDQSGDNDDQEEDDDDIDSDEMAELLAERIAEMASAKMAKRMATFEQRQESRYRRK